MLRISFVLLQANVPARQRAANDQTAAAQLDIICKVQLQQVDNRLQTADSRQQIVDRRQQLTNAHAQMRKVATFGSSKKVYQLLLPLLLQFDRGLLAACSVERQGICELDVLDK